MLSVTQKLAKNKQKLIKNQRKYNSDQIPRGAKCSSWKTMTIKAKHYVWQNALQILSKF